MAEFQALLRGTAEWKPHQLAKAGDIAKLAEAATALAETVKSALSLSRNGMEVVKLLAALQNINPLLAALDAVADEVLVQINDLKNAGFFYLYIDPYFQGNVDPKASFDLGFEQLRDEGGKRIWITKDGNGNEQETTTEPTLGDLEKKNVRPAYVTPRRLIPGGYNIWNPIPDPLKTTAKFPVFSTKDVVDEMVKAFDDEGDVPRFELREKVSQLPAKGDIVYDVDGQPVKGWDPNIKYGQELFAIGEGTINYKDSRIPLNTRKTPGRPNFKGSDAVGVGAIAIIIGASNFDKFSSVFNEFALMFSDIPELTPGVTGENLLNTLKAIIEPPGKKLSLVNHDLKFGQFEVGDIIGGEQYHTLSEVVSVNAESITTTEKPQKERIVPVDDLGEELKKADGTVIEIIELIDGNPITEQYPKGRYVNLEIGVKPIGGVPASDVWVAGDRVMTMEERGKIGNSAATTAETGIDYYSNYSFIGIHTKEKPKPNRIYSKVATVQQETLEKLPDAVQPDFAGILIDDIVPGWGEFFNELENFVKQIKGYISGSATFVQEMIDMIADIEAYLQHLVDLIDKFLEFFKITLPSEGVYALYLANQTDGNEGLKTQLKNATGIPDLSYASGILFVGVEGLIPIAGGGSKNPIDLLALILGLELQSSEEDTVNPEIPEKTVEQEVKDLASALGEAAEGSDKDEWKEKSTEDKLASRLIDRIF